MLQHIVHFSLRFRGVVVVLAGVLLAYGLLVAYHAKLDVFPDFVQPQVAIQTEAPGLSPEQVELLVTRPIEVTINGLGEMESLRSVSIGGAGGGHARCVGTVDADPIDREGHRTRIVTAGRWFGGSGS